MTPDGFSILDAGCSMVSEHPASSNLKSKKQQIAAMNWFIIFILLLVFVPLFRYSLAFLIIFLIINVLLIAGEAYFRARFNKDSASVFQFRRPKSKPLKSPRPKEYDDVQDAEFREEK